MTALHLDDSPFDSTEWIPDSGANTHVTSIVGKLDTYSPYQGTDHIQVGNGDFLQVTFTGFGLSHTQRFP